MTSCSRTHVDAVHFSLHYTAEGSPYTNDMVLRTSPAVDPREERVPGVRTKYLANDVPPGAGRPHLMYAGVARRGSGYVQLASADPQSPADL